MTDVKRSASPNALLTDIQTRAARRRTQTRDQWCSELVRHAWECAQSAPTAVARRWLDRAHRILPHDGLVLSALATAALQSGDAAAAVGLFEELAVTHDVTEGWVGLALCAHLLQWDLRRTADALNYALRRRTPDAALSDLAARITAISGAPGWCGLTTQGFVKAGPGRPDSVKLDDRPVRLRWNRGEAALPAGWRNSEFLYVSTGSTDWIGSPLPIPALSRMEGFVQQGEASLTGWAWYPADPDRDPEIEVTDAAGTVRLLLTELLEDVGRMPPLVRPRGFTLTREGLISVTDGQGRALLGSPIDAGLERRTAMAVAGGLASGAAGPVWTDIRGDTPMPGGRCAVSVVIPVYRGLDVTLACVDSVIETVPAGTPIIVVEDSSPERTLVRALLERESAGHITLIRLDTNLGFPGAANAGVLACPGRDVVLLNSDTLVPPEWLARLRAAAYSAPDIGTVTPLSNDATILSYPDIAGGNAVPDAAATAAADRLARRANGAAVVDIPTGVGFCLYLRRDCLDQVGALRTDLFAQGYGEENDFCLRARHFGWRSVAAPGIFVGHVGGHSFGAARQYLIRRNGAILNRMHPGYDALIAAHEAADPLATFRRRMDERRWAEGRCARAALLITHAGGGGVDVVIAARCSALRAEGTRAIVLRPAPAAGCRVTDGRTYPNLIYAIPAELGALARLLGPDRISHIELHHRLGHNPAIMDLAALLRVSWEIFVHDYAWFCQRIALVSLHARYCGEPDLRGCEACVADVGTLLEEDITMAALVERSGADLAGARRVVVPSRDAALRIGRHFPGVQPNIEPWEDDTTWPTPRPVPSAVQRVCVVGAIGREKGYDVLLGCARDARARGLALDFVVVGYTEDDLRLMNAGPVWITGEFKEAEAEALIRAQDAQVAWIPSIWPETWCFALSRAWQAGLPAVAFDLGAPAERIRATGRGWLLPLGLGAAAINDALLALAPMQGARHRSMTI